MDFDLWLPERYRDASRLGYLTYLRWGDVSEAPMSEDRLCDVASRLHTEAVIRLVSVAGTLLDNTHIDLHNLQLTREQQRALVRELCEPKTAANADWYLRNGRRDVFVHREQLLIAAKLAILYGKPGVPEDPIDQAHIGELLLGINTMLGQTGEQLETSSSLLTTLALRGGALGRNEQNRYAAGRYYDLLVTRARAKTLQFEETFRKAVGMSIEAYLGFALMYLEPFHGVQSVNELAIKDFLNAIGRYESQIRDQRLRQACQDAFSLDRAGFKAALQAQPGSVFGGSYLAFKERPLYRMENGSAIPISLDLLEERLAVGPYWALHSECMRRGGRRAVAQFVGQLGPVFEEYLTDLLRRIYANSHLAHVQFFDEKAIIQASTIYSASNKPPFDAAILVGDTLVLVEIFAGALALRVLERADPNRLDLDVEGHQKKIRQLARAVKEIAGNQALIKAGLDLSTIRHIFPVVALLQPYPQRQSTWLPLLNKWTLDHTLVQNHYAGTEAVIRFDAQKPTVTVHVPQIITAEEFEMLEPALRDGSLSLPGLLQQKMNDSQARFLSMKNYLLGIRRIPERANQHMRILFDVAMDAVRAELGASVDLSPPGPVAKEIQ